MEALHLTAPPTLWDHFQRRRHALARMPRDLRGVVQLWERAREFGASPQGARPDDFLVDGDALLDRRLPLEPLLAEGRDTLLRATDLFAAHNHVLLLSDADGVVTFSGGGGDFAPEARRQRLVPGATWSESARGTNAIGTAIAEDRAVCVEGAAHFGRQYHDLVCYAAPIHGPDGQVVAVLDATSRSANADPVLCAMVTAAATALEALVRARAWAGVGASARRLVESTLDRLPMVGMLIEAPGRIVRCNPAGRAWLGATPMPVRARDALGVDYATLVREATEGGAPVRIVGEGRDALRLSLEPITDAAGRVLAVVALGEPVSGVARTTRRLPKAPSRGPDAFDPVFAEDAGTRQAIDYARRVAKSELPVVLLSETGSGKELFAAAMHAASPRKDGPFVPINCGGMTAQLLESELFGYGPGAFTGADRSGRDGLLHAASGGTLFLDEVAEMPMAMQTALLRVLESGEYRRVGETRGRRADVRVVCATCRDLPALVEEGTFRKDLYFRLKSVVVRIPPLRNRTDAVALARHLLPDDAPPLSPALEAWIGGYEWPGNVRELKAVMTVVHMMGGDQAQLDVDHLPPDLIAVPVPPVPEEAASLGEVEKWAVQRALDELGGNVSAAARRLGVARSTIYRILRRGEDDAD